MPEWSSSNGRARLFIQAENMTGRFAKATGAYSYQGTNGLIAYEDAERDMRRFLVARSLILSEDDQYVYIATRGPVVEQTEQFVVSGRRSARQRRREEAARVRNR